MVAWLHMLDLSLLLQLLMCCLLLLLRTLWWDHHHGCWDHPPNRVLIPRCCC